MRSLKQFFSKGISRCFALFSTSTKRHKGRRNKTRQNKKRQTRRRSMRGG